MALNLGEFHSLSGVTQLTSLCSQYVLLCMPECCTVVSVLGVDLVGLMMYGHSGVYVLQCELQALWGIDCAELEFRRQCVHCDNGCALPCYCLSACP